MGKYTESLEDRAWIISPDDDNYIEELKEIVRSFRSFDEALDEFIFSHGYTGAVDDIDAKIDYINTRFKLASVTLIEKRELKKWFSRKGRGEKREHFFRFCFAFHLSVKESNEFFRKVCLQRGFDCHYINEAIYYYAISNQLGYSEAKMIIDKAPKDEKGKIDFGSDVLFTETIIKEIDRLKNTDELLKFLYDNRIQFGYNNAKAYEVIKRTWDKIAGESGLAQEEKKNFFEDKQTENRKNSVWAIYQQILFGESPVSKAGSDRSYKFFLKDNPLLHPLAENSFPDKKGLEAILRGEHKSNELVRKMMILLLFYEFWIKEALKDKDGTYGATYEDGERCIARINGFLEDAGYPELYYGNPFDWLFLYMVHLSYPLSDFRGYIGELYAVREDELENLL